MAVHRSHSQPVGVVCVFQRCRFLADAGPQGQGIHPDVHPARFMAASGFGRIAPPVRAAGSAVMIYDMSALADRGSDKPVSLQDVQRLLDGDVRDTVFLPQRLDARYPASKLPD